MKFELEFFEDFIQREIQGKAKKDVVGNFKQKIQAIDDEVARIKKSLRNLIFSVPEESRIKLCIQCHQDQVVQLADQVFTYIGNEDYERTLKDDSSIRLCKMLCDRFNDILVYIQESHEKYFSLTSKVPDYQAIQAILSVQKNIDRIRSATDEKSVDKSLISIALQPLIDFVEAAGKTTISFHQLIYINYLADGLARTLNESISDYENEITNFLIYLNFNSYRFLNFSTRKMNEEVQKFSSLIGKLEKLAYFKKEINQKLIKPGCALRPERLHIQQQITKWLEEEINYLEKKRHLMVMYPQKNETNDEGFKIETSLSVPQLACLAKLLIESGVITNKKHSEVIRFLAAHFSTIKNENISSESLRSKYYTVEYSTRQAVSEIIKKLQESMNKI